MTGLEDWKRRLDAAVLTSVEGRVRSVSGLALSATIPGARVGELLAVERRGAQPLVCEVVGFADDDATLVPLGTVDGVCPDDPVRSTGRPLEIRCGPSLLGRVLDGLGAPLDGGPPIDEPPWQVMRDPPNPLSRPRIVRPLPVGVRAIDGLLTVGRGQRVGLFAGSGVGKSALLGQIARQAEAEVFVVCLIGERGRELREFLDDALGREGLRRGVVVCATSDTPSLVRLKSAYVATAIAEWFRDQGRHVLLLMDSVTRFARAGREVGLAAGEAPARRGYPASVFASMPRLLERSGTAEAGSITALYTVLVEGGDLEEPIADEVRGILDGHLVLSRALAERDHFPALDVLRSLSRVMDSVVSAEHLAVARRLRALLATYEAKRDLVQLGAYKKGSDPALDEALSRIDEIERFLRQRRDESVPYEETTRALAAAV